MKEFRQVIPEGMQARVEGGCVIYTPIEVCPFEIGDVIVFQGVGLYLFEGIDQFGHVYRTISYNTIDGYFRNRFDKESGSEFFSKYTKATPEQEKLFNQKCLENGFWFDRENKKWIELKEGGVYKISHKSGKSAIFIFKEFTNGNVFDYVTLMVVGRHILPIENSPTCDFNNIINISEATEEEEQRLFDALKEKGKQWNAEKRCVEDLRWKPEDGEEYFILGSRFGVDKIKNFNTPGDSERIKFGNSFRTEKEAEKYAEYMRECSLNYKPE